jgi:hypothetical protein
MSSRVRRDRLTIALTSARHGEHAERCHHSPSEHCVTRRFDERRKHSRRARGVVGARQTSPTITTGSRATRGARSSDRAAELRITSADADEASTASAARGQRASPLDVSKPSSRSSASCRSTSNQEWRCTTLFDPMPLPRPSAEGAPQRHLGAHPHSARWWLAAVALTGAAGSLVLEVDD